MLQIREFSTHFEVSKNTFQKGREWENAPRRIPWVQLMRELAWLRAHLTFSLALWPILKKCEVLLGFIWVFSPGVTWAKA